MKYYHKKVFPKAATSDPEFGKWIKESMANGLADVIMDNMTLDKEDDCINYPEWQDENGWVTKFIGSIDISIPTKLIPMCSVYVCENCFSKNEVPTAYHFSDKVPKYCFNCGGHFTNIYRENNYYLIKEKEGAKI